MRAVVRYSDKTVDQVRSEIDAREAAAEASRKRGGKASTGAPITSAHVDALEKLRADAEAAKAQAQQT